MTATTLDYERVEHAIRYLDAHRRAQPSLADVAAELGLSPHHFQRLFRRWAGVSPKRFVQYLTAEHAKTLLRAGASVLDAALETGLSAPSRLHDLLVGFEAVTPGEYKRLGSGLTIRYGFGDSPFGDTLVATTERGVCGLAFIDPDSRSDHLQLLRERWPLSRLERDDAAAADVLERSFGADRGARPLRLFVRGTNFETRVWEALLHVPAGTATTYGALAAAVGSPSASRAVGAAVARNAVGYLIPCHRVIRATAAFGEYRWGTLRKRAILGWESAAAEAGAGGAAPTPK